MPWSPSPRAVEDKAVPDFDGRLLQVPFTLPDHLFGFFLLKELQGETIKFGLTVF